MEQGVVMVGRMHAYHVEKYWSLGRGRLPLFYMRYIVLDRFGLIRRLITADKQWAASLRWINEHGTELIKRGR
jgi:hypothetical protein